MMYAETFNGHHKVKDQPLSIHALTMELATRKSLFKSINECMRIKKVESRIRKVRTCLTMELETRQSLYKSIKEYTRKTNSFERRVRKVRICFSLIHSLYAKKKFSVRITNIFTKIWL